jgi:hypothetical protein
MNVTVQEAVDDLPPVHVTGPKSHQDRYHLDETTFSNMEGRLRVFYYCRTYYKGVRVGGKGEWRTSRGLCG